MKTLIIFYNNHLVNIFKEYHRNQAEAWDWWYKHSKENKEDRVLLIADLKKTGHKYQIEYRDINDYGEKHLKYINCYSKKEAISIIRCIKKLTDRYVITFKKLY